MTQKLSLYFFGPPQVQLNHTLVEITAQKAMALLAYLALTRTLHRRDALATLFWPGYSQKSARTYLRQALHQLTSVLGHHWFFVTREQIGLEQSALTQVDVQEFRACAKALEESDANIYEIEQRLLTLYQNDLLVGFALLDCPEFDRWQWYEAESLRLTFAEALQRFIHWHTERHEFTQAIVLACRWLALDPHQEAAHRLLMRLYTYDGQRVAALRQYEECHRFLQEGMGTIPDVLTEQLYAEIRSGELASPTVPMERNQYTRIATMRPSPPAKRGTLQVGAPTLIPSIFVGRTRELGILENALTAAQSGRGQVLFIIGGAGRGKTMLVQEFGRRAKQQVNDLWLASGHCNAYTGIGDPYLPFREMLMTLTAQEEAARQVWDTIFGSEQHSPLEEQQIFSQVTDLLKTMAERHPLLLFLEDLHWIDAASNSLLFYLSRQLAGSRILLVGTYRPDELADERQQERHPLAGMVSELKRQFGDIWLDLAHQSSEEARAFVDAYLDTQPNHLTNDFRNGLFRHTGGHALFTVELVRELQQSGELSRDEEGYWVAGNTVKWSQLPAKVSGVIEHRIGRLRAELQTILRVASVEGESFTAEMIAYVLGIDAFQVVQTLSQELDRQFRLVTVDTFTHTGPTRMSRFRFRHHLFQHYLYTHLSTSERTYLHEAVGHALETLYSAAEGIAVTLAHHFEQAGLTEKAVTYLYQAGVQAHRLAANQQALAHLDHALTLLSGLPDTKAHSGQELAILITKARVAKYHLGFSTNASIWRAYELCQQIGDANERFAVLHALYSYKQSYAQGYETTLEMLRIAQNQERAMYLVSAHHMIGHTLLGMGKLETAHKHLDQAIALYHPQDHADYLVLCGQDEGIAAMANQAKCLWYLGYPDVALQLARDTVALATELGHPMSIAMALHHLVNIYLLRREFTHVYRQLDDLTKLTDEHGHELIASYGTFYRCDALVREGKVEAGSVLLVEQMAEMQAKGVEYTSIYGLQVLARAAGQRGDFPDGLTLLEKAQRLMTEQSGGLLHLPDVLLLKGELQLVQAQQQAASRENLMETENSFVQAINTARQQQAKSYELRAMVALCKLWQQQGKLVEAHAALSEVYGWFSEGFDTPDLVDAQKLLDELTTETASI